MKDEPAGYHACGATVHDRNELRRFAADVVAGRMPDRPILCLHGPARSGKSTYASGLCDFVRGTHCGLVDLKSPWFFGVVCDRPLVTIDFDTELSRDHAAVLKAITTGTDCICERKGQPPERRAIAVPVIIVCNEPPPELDALGLRRLTTVVEMRPLSHIRAGCGAASPT